MTFYGWQLDALDYVAPIGLCTHCDEPGCNYIDVNGRPWHKPCYDAWIEEYNGYLDALQQCDGRHDLNRNAI